MPALDFRKLLVSLVLASAASVPAWAGEVASTAQQTVLGQAAIEVAAAQPAAPAIVDQTYATENNGRVATARPRPRAAESRVVRQARVTYHRPGLILGIGY